MRDWWTPEKMVDGTFHPLLTLGILEGPGMTFAIRVLTLPEYAEFFTRFPEIEEHIIKVVQGLRDAHKPPDDRPRGITYRLWKDHAE